MVMNWEAVPEFFDSDMTCIQQNLEAELVGDFLQCVNADYSNPHNFLDPWYDTCSLVNFEYPGFDHLHPPSSFKPDMFPVQDFEPYALPKRQKCSKDYQYPDLTPGFSSAFVPNPGPRPEYFPGAFSTAPALDFQHAEVVDGSTRKPSVENVGKKVEERSVSPQSIAARERRRKITEKTQELGKLVPGGSKMNTAEMLTAAYSYVKFLQAQMGILQFMGSFQEVKAATATKVLHVAASPTIQEKLYMEQKCLVPKEFVEVLANYFDAQSKLSLSHKLNQLLKSSG